MKKILASLLISGATFAQTDSVAINIKANEIVEKYLTAIGGRENIGKIQDITISSTTDTPRGVSETEMKFKFPYKMVMSVFANGMDVFSTTCDGTKLVRKSGMMMGGQQNREKEGRDAELEVMAMSPFAETTLKERGIWATGIAEETVDGKTCTKISWTNKDGQTSATWFDNATGYKIKTAAKNKTPRGEVEMVRGFDNYTKFKGTEVFLPKVQKQTNPMMGGEMVSEVNSVKVNKGIDDKAFVIK